LPERSALKRAEKHHPKLKVKRRKNHIQAKRIEGEKRLFPSFQRNNSLVFKDFFDDRVQLDRGARALKARKRQKMKSCKSKQSNEKNNPIITQ
jgi:hypothetical protein